MKAPNEPLGRAIDDYFELLASGEGPNPFDYRESLGAGFPDFLRALEAKAALEDLVEPGPETPRELGPYELVRRIGRGACGEVYEARDRRSGERVALKLLFPAYDGDAQVTRFRREGRIGERVRHPHLVEIFESGSADERRFFAMRLVDGETLKRRIRDGALRETSDNLRQFAGVADGLAALHRAGAIHRDVKPSNIMVAPDGTFLLGDYGLSRATLESTITITGQTLGTLGYMSPEQLTSSRAVDRRSDIYSLGATLYEAFCGRPPIRGGLDDALRAAWEDSPPDPAAVNPAISPELRRVIMTAMERRPRDRYASAEALRDDLLALVERRSVAGRPVSPLRRWVRRHVRALVAAVLLAAYVGHLVTRPATIEIVCRPPAEVLVNGESRGQTPLSLDLAPGRHEFEFRLKDFRILKVPRALERGSNARLEPALVPIDPSNREAMRELERSLGYEDASARLDTSRGGTFPLGRAVLPGGRCRLADLEKLRFEIGHEQPFPVPARLSIRRGGEVLFEKSVHSLELVNEFEFPASARDRLRPGDTVVWGVVDAKGNEYVARCEIVPAETARAALARIDRLYEGPSAVRSYLRAQALLVAGLPLAAYREAAAAGGERVLSLAMSARALRALGVSDSRLGDALIDAIAELPIDVRGAWFR